MAKLISMPMSRFLREKEAEKVKKQEQIRAERYGRAASKRK
jgi:hypothetical protein